MVGFVRDCAGCFLRVSTLFDRGPPSRCLSPHQSFVLSLIPVVPVLAGVATFILSGYLNNELNAADVFTIMALYNTLRFSMATVPNAAKVLSRLHFVRCVCEEFVAGIPVPTTTNKHTHVCLSLSLSLSLSLCPCFRSSHTTMQSGAEALVGLKRIKGFLLTEGDIVKYPEVRCWLLFGKRFAYVSERFLIIFLSVLVCPLSPLVLCAALSSPAQPADASLAIDLDGSVFAWRAISEHKKDEGKP
jgi:hypothetical protein